MHDQSASRISGRTLTAVAAMSVRALRIVVLKSAGNFTRDGQYDPGAEKFPARAFAKYGICCAPAIFERQRGRPRSKISGCGQSARQRWRFISPCRVWPREGGRWRLRPPACPNLLYLTAMGDTVEPDPPWILSGCMMKANS
jgi:hypothetical protein